MTAIETSVYALLAGLFGLAFGSFGTVVISRFSSGDSIVKPKSHCVYCKHELAWFENVPVFSYLLLGGRCRDCKTAISWMYPLVELLTAALFVISVLCVGTSSNFLTRLALLGFACVSIPLVVIDFRLQRLPDFLTLSCAVFSALCVVVFGMVTNEWQYTALALFCGLLPALVLLVIRTISRGGMGLGDVKLSAAIGFSLGLLGWQSVAVGFELAFFIAGVVALILLVLKKAGRKTRLPMGPFLIAGAWLSVVGGPNFQAVILSTWLVRA